MAEDYGKIFTAGKFSHEQVLNMMNDFWQDIRFDASDLKPDYVGLHRVHGASTADENWKIFKFTYAGADTTRVEMLFGAWDDRATLLP
jgi:hypothetical protein